MAASTTADGHLRAETSFDTKGSSGLQTSDVHVSIGSNAGPVGDARLSELVKLIGERTNHGLERLAEAGGVQGVIRSLHSDAERGLCGKDKIERSRHIYGGNFVPKPKPRSLLELMWDALQDTTLIILIIAGVISLILGVTVEEDKSTGWIEGAAIMVSVVIVVMVTAINDLQKERQFQELQKQQDNEKLVSVIRDGHQQRINVADLVCGDVVLLAQGAIIPADGILISSSDLATDESAMTGESREIRKGDSDPFVLSGTSVKLGSGVYVVTGVGLFSEEGIINKIITGVGKKETRELEEREAEMFHTTVVVSAEDADADIEKKLKAKEEKEKKDKESPAGRKKESALQAKLSRMALQIGYIGTTVAIITVIALFIRYFTTTYSGYSSQIWSELLSFLIVGITVLVVAVPEGLPLAVTISLAYSVKKMMLDHNLVRVLAACETMGNATTICSDKTGTLTKNKMTVVRTWIATHDLRSGEFSRIPTMMSEEVRNRIAQHIAYNSSPEANYTIGKDLLPAQDGNKTECAILFFADTVCPRKYREIRADPISKRLKTFPFDSAKKRMTTVMPLPNGKYRVFVKGAAEIILEFCNARENTDGTTTPLSASDKERLVTDVIKSYAAEALRVILMAYKDINEPPGDVEDDLVNNLIITAFVGIQDPVRDEVPAAVLSCQTAGVVVRMLTGDNMETARAIAYNCSILLRNQELQEYTVMEGPTFRSKVVKADGSLDFAAMLPICRQLRVMGRCSPSDKYNLVRGLKHYGQTVAVTGDGTNDGPALSEANVGFSMGITGTGVAKEASDIIITDDNFTSIVKAISWGRNVYDSIAKFLTFQLTVNVVAITVAFIGACAINESPLKAVQMLWVNLIMDSLASLALATEPPTPELLLRKPYDRSQPLISAIMLRQILGHALHQLVVMFVLVFAGDSIFKIESGRGHGHNASPTQHYTIVFNAFVMMQLFNEVNARKIHGQFNVFKGLFNNSIFVIVLVVTLFLQVIIVEFGGFAFRTTSLSWWMWIACVIIGSTSLLWNIVLNMVPETIFPAKWFAPRNKMNLDNAVESALSDSSTLVTVDENSSLLPGTETMPLEMIRNRSGRPAAELWGLTKATLQRHLTVVSAFRLAGLRLRERRLTIRDIAEADLPHNAAAAKQQQESRPVFQLDQLDEEGGTRDPQTSSSRLLPFASSSAVKDPRGRGEETSDV